VFSLVSKIPILMASVLQLDLFEDTVVGSSKTPWEGRSPRALTRGSKMFTLKAQAAKSVSDFVDDDQFDLWLPVKKAPWEYQGAPLLKEV